MVYDEQAGRQRDWNELVDEIDREQPAREGHLGDPLRLDLNGLDRAALPYDDDLQIWQPGSSLPA